MIQQEFMDLQKGDRVKFIGGSDLCTTGEIVVRTPNWLDCPKSQRFANDKHVFFLRADEVEKV